MTIAFNGGTEAINPCVDRISPTFPQRCPYGATPIECGENRMRSHRVRKFRWQAGPGRMGAEWGTDVVQPRLPLVS